MFFLHRSYSNKSNKIYFIFFAFFFEFIWNLQIIAKIKHKIKKKKTPNSPLTSGPHWSVGQNRVGGQARPGASHGALAGAGGRGPRPAVTGGGRAAAQ